MDMDDAIKMVDDKNRRLSDEERRLFEEARALSRINERAELRKKRQNKRKVQIATLIIAGFLVVGISSQYSDIKGDIEAKSYANENILKYEQMLGVNGDSINQFEVGYGRDGNNELLVDYKPVHLANVLVETTSREDALYVLASAMNIVNEGYEDYVLAALDIASQREDAPDYLKGGLLSLTGCDNYENAKETVRKTAINLHKEAEDNNLLGGRK